MDAEDLGLGACSQALLREPGSEAISPAGYMVVSVFLSMKAKSKSSQLE